MSKRDTAATLEHQAAADSGLEELPEFELPEEHANGVRPSERCGNPSKLGIGCTFKAFHSGNHSWDLGTPIQEQQPELPGTPEPAENEYTIPYESAFKGADFQSARGIAEIGDRFIETTEEFAHLRGIEVRYLWKRRGGLKGGAPRLGALQKPGGLTAYALGHPQFILWLAADHCREAKLTNEQMDALIFDLLCRGVADPDDHSAFRVAGPDYEGNVLTLDKFGFWHPDLRELGAHIKQLNLLDTLALPEPDDEDDEADESEESE